MTPIADHAHRRPRRSDFEGKTIERFYHDADNVWRFAFTDGTSLAIQSDLGHSGVAIMELCEVCGVKERPRARKRLVRPAQENHRHAPR